MNWRNEFETEQILDYCDQKIIMLNMRDLCSGLKENPGTGRIREQSQVGARLFFIVFAIAAFSSAHSPAEEMKPGDMLRLAMVLEDKGYLESAKTYYERLQRDPDAVAGLGAEVEKRLAGLDAKLKTRSENNGLEPLDELPLVQLSPDKSELSQKEPLLVPDDFPPTKMNKKRWMIGAAIVTSIAAYAYYYRISHKEPPPPPPPPPHPSVGVTF